MSAGGADGTAARPADAEEEDVDALCQAGSSLAVVELPRKRKGGEAEERRSADVQMEDELTRSEGEDQQVKMKCFREPHSQIEKRRRDKMNTLIEELSAMIPACQHMARKLDKLTVLRKAVQHLNGLKAGSSSTFPHPPHRPSILPHDELRQLLLRAADGFLLVVSCDRGKILFISESVSKILNFSPLELTGQSLFDFIHPKDISKVKEQLASSELHNHRLADAAAGVPVQADAPLRPSVLTTGARRAFFCRMKHSRVMGKHDKHALPSTSKKKDAYRYCTLHCTGYMRSWLSSQLDAEGDAADKDASSPTCLVTVCRLLPPGSHHPPRDVPVKPAEFMTRCAIDGKFTFVDHRATALLGYLPQEILGTSCYEYFHQDDLQHLADKHRQVLRSKEKIETSCYKFKTKQGSYASLQSQWFSFVNPWTKEVEFIVSLNRVIPGSNQPRDEEPGSSRSFQEDTKHIPEIPGLSTGSGPMIYAGSIGTQIANELTDSYRMNSSPSSGAASPLGPPQDKCPLTSSQPVQSASSREETTGGSSESKSDSATTASAASESAGEPSQGVLDNMVVPGLSTFSSDEAAMAVIMSLLEADVNMGQSVDFEDLHWPF
uniref:Basic helix-loop-helix ARNT like 2 n=1 Tax=Takifugu rubripes TaxID=31033 RepID=H2S3K3_TAKRU